MAPSLSKHISKKNALIGGAVAGVPIILYLLKKCANEKKKNSKKLLPQSDIKYLIVDKSAATKNANKAHVDARFLKQLWRILKIVFPGVMSTEFGFLILVAASLVARSYSDIWMIQNGTMVETAIVNMDQQLFIKRLIYFFAGMPIISIVNNVLKWSIGELKLRLRTRLTNHLFEDYLRGYTYYKMNNLDTRISNPDQLLTADVDKFCDMFTDLYSNICKPFLDIVIYVYKLTTTLGFQTPTVMLSYLVFAGTLLTYLRRPTGRMTVIEQKLEGEYRYINSRLITNSEEIAFYNGNNREKLTILTAFNRLTNHLRKFLEFKVGMGVIDNIIGKYIASVVGFYAVSIPFIDSKSSMALLSKDERFRNYYTMGRMLVKLAEAIGRLVLAGRDMTRLAGFTARVTEIMTVLDDLNNGKYVRTMLTNNDMSNKRSLVPNSGKIVTKDNIIKFEKVPLVTPNGDILIDELSFEVKSGMNVLVCGPNGCGKSSLFRVLGELWPMFGGILTKPPKGKLFYIPQKPYMTLGTLRDQIIYPHTKEEMQRRGKSDADIAMHLERVQLSYLLQRDEGWDTVADWIDVLSGGEKQRIAMARLFYHRPQFAILDECTSAVSVDVEGSMYQYCRESGITLFTVSHRKSLWKHHDYYLQMDGRGMFQFSKIDSETEEFGS
ncbi:ATP-binding cassette sub-family D member 3 [Daktulosphaira vitifoliae]|uniref:ATP-binding cassette sub-family D member 3 n=1 Tax=Daktulosphaira vitifoliae TaxID=58002 RepID=UPI0021A9F607|nr:ATP-binding cassette sub-family D member 3 [Daktulosphaira vitifoliae]XP_050532035.1 ATP-binding cassette sub-family D member 3 [Daktulosphaira vitifoliae]XP_050532036.1 ATP-binding cassette sub-family D member 3 [Daktulosphaira vitifoliae]